jgi:hypothetical protein
MKTFPKILALLVVVPATFYFCQMAAWLLVGPTLGFNSGTITSLLVGSSQNSPLFYLRYIGLANGLFAATVTGWFMWRGLSESSPGISAYALRMAILTGGGLFAMGFAGPIVTGWGGNQGPMLGFIIGPAAFVLGLAGGAAIWMLREWRVGADVLVSERRT